MPIPASILPNETSLYQGVWVVAPSVGTHRTEFTLALLNMSAPINTNCGIYMPIGMKVDEVRNVFAQAAIDHEIKYILFIDEDVLVLPHTLRRLMYWMEQHDELMAVGGVYCAKDPADPDAKPYPLVFRGDGGSAYWDWRYGELFEVSGLGMGCTMIRVDALKKMTAPWFLTQKYSENIRNEKGEITGKHHFQGTEDLYFFRRLRKELGGQIYCDGSLVFEHIDPKGKRYSLPPDCKILRPTTFNGKVWGNQGKVVLNLGCGTTYDIFEEGIAIRVDLREEANPDYRADLKNLPFEDEFADVVFSSHTLEHFGRWEVEEILKEWIRVLKPGGILRLVVPNVAWAARKIIEADGQITKSPVGRDVLDVLYGEQNYPLNFHKFGFTKDLLRSTVMTYGIDEPMFSETDYSLIMEARKKGSFADPVQSQMRGKLKEWIRSPAGGLLTPDGKPVPQEELDKAAAEAGKTVDEVIRGWTIDQTPKAWSAFWDPNREAAVALAGLTRQVRERGYLNGDVERRKVARAEVQAPADASANAHPPDPF